MSQNVGQNSNNSGGSDNPLTQKIKQLLCEPAFRNKFVVIHKEAVWGCFPEFHMALDIASNVLQPGDFMIVDANKPNLGI